MWKEVCEAITVIRAARCSEVQGSEVVNGLESEEKNILLGASEAAEGWKRCD